MGGGERRERGWGPAPFAARPGSPGRVTGGGRRPPPRPPAPLGGRGRPGGRPGTPDLGLHLTGTGQGVSSDGSGPWRVGPRRVAGSPDSATAPPGVGAMTYSNQGRPTCKCPNAAPLPNFAF